MEHREIFAKLEDCTKKRKFVLVNSTFCLQRLDHYQISEILYFRKTSNMDSSDEAQIAYQKFTSGDYECAESLYAELLEKDNQNTEYLAHKAECNFKLSKFQTCLDDVKFLMSLNPADHVDAFISGGRAATKLEKYEDAYHCYKAGLKIVPKHKEIIEDLRELQKIIIKDVETKAAAYEERDYNAVDFCTQDRSLRGNTYVF